MVRVAARVLTPEEKRDHVIAYVWCPHGQKTKYLSDHGITMSTMNRWKAALADGDLAEGRVPRHTGEMTRRDVSEIRRLEREITRLETERDQARAETQTMRQVAEALGKAIGVMEHLHGAASTKDESN